MTYELLTVPDELQVSTDSRDHGKGEIPASCCSLEDWCTIGALCTWFHFTIRCEWLFFFSYRIISGTRSAAFHTDADTCCTDHQVSLFSIFFLYGYSYVALFWWNTDSFIEYHFMLRGAFTVHSFLLIAARPPCINNTLPIMNWQNTFTFILAPVYHW